MQVFLYGDYGCPFTYLENARLDVLASEGVITVTWRPLASPGGEPQADPSLIHEAAKLGLALSIPAVRPDTRAASQAAEFAHDCGEASFRRLHAALFRAVFVEGADVADENELVRIAEGVGIDREGLAAALSDARYEEVLGEIEAEAARYGIESTPTMLIGRYKLVGAAPSELLRSTVARATAS